MRVVVTGTRGIPNVMGGVETHCEELFPRLAARGVDAIVIRRSSYAKDALREWRGVKLHDIATPKKKSLEAIVHTFRAINKAKQLEADVVHIHAIGPALLAPYAKLLGMRVVFTHHGPDYDRDKWGNVAKFILRLGERMGCKYADEVIVISNVIRELIANKYNRCQHVHLIYNGVSTPEICSYPEYFAELGIEEGKYVLATCRFVKEKNLHHLVAAYSQLKERGIISDGMKLVLAGDTEFEDDYSSSLKQQALEQGVVLTGFIKGKRLHALLTHALLFCLPSSHEGLPIALLEAMSYRLPVVVSDIPANKEVGLPTDSYFPCGNIEALKAHLCHYLTTPLQRINYSMSLYDWDKIATQTLAVYESLVQRE